MKAARLHEYGKPLQLDDVPRPTPSHGQVVVKVLGAGFCHSDLHVIDGEIRILPKMPLTLGHENAGVVSDVGPGITLVKEGDPVAVFGGWGCRTCDLCIAGEEQLCANAQWPGLSKYDGGYAEYLLVPHEAYLVKLGKLSPRDAAPLTDAALTPYRAVKKALPYLSPSHPVLTIGVGGLGQYGLKLLQLLSGAPIIAVDTSEEKRALAKRLGATHVLDGRAKDLTEQIRSLTGGQGVSAALDFVGADATLATAAKLVRSGGLLLHVGLAGGAARMKPLDTSSFEVRYEAPLWGNLRELREVIALVESGRLTLNETEFVPLDRINDVYRRLKAGEVKGRAVMVPG